MSLTMLITLFLSRRGTRTQQAQDFFNGPHTTTNLTLSLSRSLAHAHR